MKVGDYVRTKYGIIAKITDIIEDLSIDCDINVFYEGGLKDNNPMMEIPYYLKDKYIIKSRPKIEIIDLIKVGDYVNGSKVQEIGEGYVEIEEYSGLNNDMPCVVKTEDIKSIVTKEQFERMQYNLESEVN